MCISNVKSKNVDLLDKFQTQECSNCLQIQNARERERENTYDTTREKKKKKIIMPKSKKALLKPQKQPPFLIKVLLFLAAMGVNINRPPPMKKLVAGASMAFALLIVLFLLFRPNVSSERPDRSTVRCARTFPAVASHQLLTGEPTVKSGGLEAMDYLRDGFGVTNFDIGTRRARVYTFRRFVFLSSSFSSFSSSQVSFGLGFPLFSDETSVYET